tara:strand:+ start:3205 stop:4275 length:1071 start_codon:yes stop_codon:yes gene_type:complete
MANKYNKLHAGFDIQRTLLLQNLRGWTGHDLLVRYKQTLRVKDTQGTNWADWVNSGASRDGYGMEARFKGWGFNSPFPAVPFVFLDYMDRVVPGVLAVLVSTPKNGRAVFVTIDHSGEIKENTRALTNAAPVFVNKIGGANKVARDAAELCSQVQKIFNTEVRDDLDSSSFDAGNGGNPWVVNEPRNPFTSAEAPDHKQYKIKVTDNNKFKLEETNTMKNTKTDNFIQDQKAIAKEIASLNAGRVSNKVVKEAMRPLVALLFKPTFMQKIAMKLTGAKNPLDEFMNTPYADLLCAQLFKVVIDMREVDNVHVKKTANSAVVYAGLKVTEQLPVEDLIDNAIKQVTEATTKAIGKGE